MIDPLAKDIILSEITDIFNCINFVSNNLNSENTELKNEAERIGRNLKHDIPEFKNNLGVQGYLREIVEKEYSQIDFLMYLARVEEALEFGTDVQPIIEEMDSLVYHVLEALHGRTTENSIYQ